MALTTFVTYVTANGAIHAVEQREAGDPPLVAGGHSVLDVGLLPNLPRKKTHRIDLAGPTLVLKSDGEQQTEENAERKRQIEMTLGYLDAVRQNLHTRGFIEARDELDAQIAALEAEHGAL